MSKPYAPSTRFNAAGVTTGSVLALIVAMAASVPLTAHAEYRCDSPSTAEDARACELVKHAAPDELRLFVDRTRSIYGLDFVDYVTSTDVDRCQAARLEDRSTSVAASAPAERTSEEQRN